MNNVTCPNQIALCKMHNCATCNFHGDESSCPFFNKISYLESIPTFQQMIDIYQTGNASKRRKNNVVNTVKNDLYAVGLMLDDKYTLLTKLKFKMLIEQLKSPDRQGGALRDISIASHLSAFKAITSEIFEDKYEELGFLMPTFKIPKFTVIRPKVQEISDYQARLFDIQMEKWLASGTESDRNCFIYAFFYKYCGMRAGDICSAKWSILKQTTIGIMLVYTPHKTAKFNKIVSFPLNNKVFAMIKPLIGDPDEYVIPRHENRIPKSFNSEGKDGTCKGMHLYLRKKVNQALHKIGIGNEYRGQKAAHALRKYFETDLAYTIGREKAAAYAGHTLKTQANNYLGTYIGKIEQF